VKVKTEKKPSPHREEMLIHTYIQHFTVAWHAKLTSNMVWTFYCLFSRFLFIRSHVFSFTFSVQIWLLIKCLIRAEKPVSI